MNFTCKCFTEAGFVFVFVSVVWIIILFLFFHSVYVCIVISNLMFQCSSFIVVARCNVHRLAKPSARALKSPTDSNVLSHRLVEIVYSSLFTILLLWINRWIIAYSIDFVIHIR